MNLSDITTKPWILALFKRDDGERFLLGDGYYDFKDSLQHFQPNTMANDIVELQGTDGQLLAGQVRRGASQSFDGIIGDGTTTKKVVEERRRDFLMFFRKKHFYTVIYIFCDGTAIKRERGYLVDAPSVPEIRQLAPSYHVALNFENVNYYEYREDSDGNEIYSNTRNVVISTLMTGGLIWDNLGAVSEALQWANEQTAQGAYITINDGLMRAPMSLTQLNGNATQSGTPTPDAPVPVSTVTGENTVKVMGKNLFNTELEQGTIAGNNGEHGGVPLDRVRTVGRVNVQPNTTYTLSVSSTLTMQTFGFSYKSDGTWIERFPSAWAVLPLTFTTDADTYEVEFVFSSYPNANISPSDFSNIMLNVGSTAKPYEPYQGQTQEINLGKNLFDASTVTAGYRLDSSGQPYADASYSLSDYIRVMPNASYTYSFTGTAVSSSSAICFYKPDKTFISRIIPITSATTTSAVITAPANAYYARIADFNSRIATIQLEAGAQATSYSAYFTPIELCKIGTYQDRIYKDEGKWYIEKQVGKVVLNGTDTATVSYAMYGAKDNVSAVNITLNGIISGNTSLEAMSDKFTVYGTGRWQDWYGTAPNIQVGNMGKNSAGAGIYCGIPTTENTIELVRTWFGNNPTTVYYQLATPTTTEITDATLLSQLNFVASLYEGVNNISLTPTAGAQGTMEISYFTELQPGGGFEWEDGGTGGATIINVEGVDAASPIWTIKGSATNPTLTNITTGQTITWTGTVPSGQTLIIDIDKQTATMEGANVFEFISGDWLDLAPGINRVTYSVLGTDQPSTLSWNNIVG